MLQKDVYRTKSAQIIWNIFTSMHTHSENIEADARRWKATSKGCLHWGEMGERVLKEDRRLQP